MESEPFKKSVVLISEHHGMGTVGFIVNKASDIKFSRIMLEKGIEWPFDDTLYLGGPVNSSALVCLHTTEWYSSNTMQISDDFAISSDNFMTEKISMGNIPQNYRMIGGMSGWAPNQLEQEIEANKWLTTHANPSIIYETQGESTWIRAIEQCASQATATFF